MSHLSNTSRLDSLALYGSCRNPLECMPLTTSILKACHRTFASCFCCFCFLLQPWRIAAAQNPADTLPCCTHGRWTASFHLPSSTPSFPPPVPHPSLTFPPPSPHLHPTCSAAPLHDPRRCPVVHGPHHPRPVPHPAHHASGVHPACHPVRRQLGAERGYGGGPGPNHPQRDARGGRPVSVPYLEHARARVPLLGTFRPVDGAVVQVRPGWFVSGFSSGFRTVLDCFKRLLVGYWMVSGGFLGSLLVVFGWFWTALCGCRGGVQVLSAWVDAFAVFGLCSAVCYVAW